MTNALYTLAGAVLVLGVMILVHEFGHFAAAKLLGVRVEVFSIGFGKRLFGFRHGDTDYRISALP
jgi:regulator of sigma E protease